MTCHYYSSEKLAMQIILCRERVTNFAMGYVYYTLYRSTVVTYCCARAESDFCPISMILPFGNASHDVRTPLLSAFKKINHLFFAPHYNMECCSSSFLEIIYRLYTQWPLTFWAIRSRQIAPSWAIRRKLFLENDPYTSHHIQQSWTRKRIPACTSLLRWL